ncbi:hypothetical protein VTK26DRAFT_675 [Humicola hyalothermophila]
MNQEQNSNQNDEDDNDNDEEDDENDDGEPTWRSVPGLPVFTAEDTAEINPAENDLLLLLRRYTVSYSCIAQNFFQRHTRHGCEGRRTTLKKQGR